MQTFYFTYGTDGHPFYGGWTEVVAPDQPTACMIFKMIHPDRKSGLLRCSSVYDEERFQKSPMYVSGNFGFRCHERLTLQHEIFTTEKEQTV